MHKTGKGQWTAGFLEELQSRTVDITTVSDKEGSCDVYFPKGIRWHWKCAKWLKQSQKIDLYLSPVSYIVPSLLGDAFAYAPVIHDLIAFQSGKHDVKARRIEKLLLGRTLKHAKHIFVISEATKKDLLQKYPSLPPKHLTPLFAGPMHLAPPPNKSDRKTILCAGTLCPRKNQLRLMEAYAQLPSQLRRRYRLVLVGSRGWHDASIVQRAEQIEGVQWRDYVTDDEYSELLRTCAVFAFPSLYEGFGMQVLDALQRGTPVLTSDRGSLSEVAGSAAVTVDPLQTESITRGLEIILSDTALQSNLRKRGPLQAARFSWEKTVDIFLQQFV